ncbi:MAG: glycosyltransferase [Anaerolineales bacterium]|nr:glycosyltransferase [Anaerolineales bacterium]
MIEKCSETNARLATYDWDDVVAEKDSSMEIWADALRDCDVAVCTVHPPREGFHCSVFAARCIKRGNLKTHLIPKTGTIVPEYLREFYLSDETINSSVITIADFTRKYLIDTYKIPEEIVALIYQGTDVRSLTPSAQGRSEALKRYPLPQDAAPIIGYAGSFEHRKGLPVLFDAIHRLSSGHLPKIHLMLVGDGPDEEMLREKARAMGLDNNISFFPFTSNPKYIFERIDITVLSSIYKEGLPNILLESMAMGVPVVSSNLGGVIEAVQEGKTGYVVDPGDSDQLAEAIIKLWVDQEAYNRMSENARQLMEDQFDKNDQFDRFLEYFEECVSGTN